uniref:Uncharacterized protein n=1 Tax=Lactuca sativa TaxID=4236 RepID=A0A9R1W035_LACSA|nr:hypothetical protein LSAT_V11C300122280 [Lactuca sativa]
MIQPYFGFTNPHGFSKPKTFLFGRSTLTRHDTLIRLLIISALMIFPSPNRLGPIFLYCGNEGDIEWFAANTDFVWELAPRFGAIVIFPEVKALITLLYINFFTCRPLIIQFYQNLRDLI